MFPNATVSSRSSSSRSGNSCSRNSSMPSLRVPNKTSYNPLFPKSDAISSFDASHFAIKDKIQLSRNNHLRLRRYNSQESHTDVIEISKNSKDNTPDSTKSRSENKTPDTSPGSTEERDRRQSFEARDFLERYSLPRIVRVEDGEPLLLYRCFDSFTKVQAKGICGKKGKEKTDMSILYFPEGYSGWFSLANEKGEKAAVTHSSLLQLVREQVCSFISVQSFTAYTAGNQESSEIPNTRSQYLKTHVRGGQVFQLRAVFQHRDRSDGRHHSTKSSHVSRSARDKDLANRYAQLIGQNNQELYVPLTTKGEFYETYSSIKAKLCFPGMLDKTGPLAIDKDCLYRLAHLLRRVALPLKVKLISGPLPQGIPKDFTDTFILDKKFQEPLMVTCTLPPPSENIKHEISCINLNSRVKIAKCSLGFDSENKLLKSQRVQAAMAFCHKNIETWYREVRLYPNLPLKTTQHTSTNLLELCNECKKLNQYCSENCLNNSSSKDVKVDSENKQLITKEVKEKFPKSKKWYRYFKFLNIKTGSNSIERYQDIKDPMDGIEKVKSIERYKDMSKLLEDRFGKQSYNPVKKSASFMYSSKRLDLKETPTDKVSKPALLKCQSLDNQMYSVSNEKESLEMFKTQVNRKTSNASDTSEFQMCLLGNGFGCIDRREIGVHTSVGRSFKDLTLTNLRTTIDIDQIKPVETRLKKTKPDLIPTLPKQDNLYITERLCSEFHVKTKIQRRNYHKQMLLSSTDNLKSSGRITDLVKDKHGFSIFNDYYQNIKSKNSFNLKAVTVQVHEESLPKVKKLPIIDDIPYSHVADELHQKSKGVDENIYSEICEDMCNCDSIHKCKSSRTKKGGSEYCYLQLGSNGESIVQTDSDEAIYNTLR